MSCRTALPPLFTVLILVACITFQGCNVLVTPEGARRSLPRELNMQTPQNPTAPGQSGEKSPPIPEMVGATSERFYLTEATSQISIPMHLPTGPARLRDKALRRVYLNVENLTSDARAPSYSVYLNLPPDEKPEEHPELYAGGLAMFGLVESSRPDDQHPANGLSYKLDVTEVFRRLSARRDWDSKNLDVTFVPGRWEGPIKVQVGRVSIYFA